MNIKRVAAAFLATALGLGAAQQASANNLIEVPTNWRLQNYAGAQGVVIWFSSATCSQGHLNTSNLSESDKDRLWSLVLTAKMTSRKIGIFYDVSGDVCQISSFYMDAG